MIYDLIIIGAGAAGLFAGASLPSRRNGLILEKKSSPGKKLMMSGAGQCNLTHGGSIKEFMPHYGKNGSEIRPILYQYNNQAVIDFFEKNRVPLIEREDHKIFPASLKAHDILDVLVKRCTENGLLFQYSSGVDRISINRSEAAAFTLQCGELVYESRTVILAAGGSSYPSTGSDGSIFPVLTELGIRIIPPSPALVPIFVRQYPFHTLSGISFQDAEVTAGSVRSRDALLLTHNCFSGPAILNLSRVVQSGNTIRINYCPGVKEESASPALRQRMAGNNRQLQTVLQDYFKEITAELPKRYLESVCLRAGADPAEKASRIPGSVLKEIIRLIFRDEYHVERLGGFESAMVTTGGVSLSEIDVKSMESIQYPGLFFAGEILDVDGDTGGYNLQFAFSSGRLAALHASMK